MRLAVAAAWVILPIAAGSGLYLLKMQVEAQEQHLASLERRIADTTASIHVLEAEWSYLNDPGRLRDEAVRLLGMKPVRPDQIVGFDRIPYPDPAPAAAAAPPTGRLAESAPHSADPLAAAIAALAAANAPARRKHP